MRTFSCKSYSTPCVGVCVYCEGVSFAYCVYDGDFFAAWESVCENREYKLLMATYLTACKALQDWSRLVLVMAWYHQGTSYLLPQRIFYKKKITPGLDELKVKSVISVVHPHHTSPCLKPDGKDLIEFPAIKCRSGSCHWCQPPIYSIRDADRNSLFSSLDEIIPWSRPMRSKAHMGAFHIMT